MGLEDQLLRILILRQQVIQVKSNPSQEAGSEELNDSLQDLRKDTRARVQTEAQTAIKVVDVLKLQT